MSLRDCSEWRWTWKGPAYFGLCHPQVGGLGYIWKVTDGKLVTEPESSVPPGFLFLFWLPSVTGWHTQLRHTPSSPNLLLLWGLSKQREASQARGLLNFYIFFGVFPVSSVSAIWNITAYHFLFILPGLCLRSLLFDLSLLFNRLGCRFQTQSVCGNSTWWFE